MNSNGHYGTSFAQYTQELSLVPYEILSTPNERSLLFAYASGSVRAFEQLVSSHLRFVVHSLRSYKIPNEIDLMDVIQEANLGLMEGIRRFDPVHYNCRVFTYCVWWIRFYINRYLAEQRKFSKLQTYVKTEQEESVLETFPDIGHEDLVIGEQVAADIVHYAFEKLEPRERAILILFFGLEPPYAPKTLEEIGSIVHMNFERVRQLKNIALAKLRPGVPKLL